LQVKINTGFADRGAALYKKKTKFRDILLEMMQKILKI